MARSTGSESIRTFELTGEGITIDILFKAATNEQAKFSLSKTALEKMQNSRSYIESRIAKGDVMYGVNTGFGAFASKRISDSEIEELQRNLIRSHSVGIGKPFSIEQSKAMMILRANTLARGHSGIRPQVVEKILEFLNHNIIPVIPSQGSVGASGDLAPLSHLALALIGEGEAWDNHQPIPVETLLKKHKIQPLVLKAKEGLSLINGCQVMTAVGMLALKQAKDLMKMSDVAAAISLEALKGSRNAFRSEISEVRPHRGEIKTAANMRSILDQDSQINKSHENCNKVQDAYSLRCIPAVHGAAKDAIEHVSQVLEIEANSSTDNPLVFEKADEILSCGNFHGMPVAFAMDYAAIAMTALMSMSERRVAHLTNPAVSELPAFLTNDGGLNSGHMITHVAAASLVSESKVLSHPASVDSIPTSADKEDHVSMGTISARKFAQIIEHFENVIAMEFICATQGLEFHRPLKSSDGIEKILKVVREKVPFATKDRIFYKDTQRLAEMIKSGYLIEQVEKTFPDLSY